MLDSFSSQINPATSTNLLIRIYDCPSGDIGNDGRFNSRGEAPLATNERHSVAQKVQNVVCFELVRVSNS